MNYPYEVVPRMTELSVRAFSTCNLQSEFYPPHWHSDIELIFLLRGALALTINNHTVVLEPDGFILIHSNRIHSIQSGADTYCYVLQISQNLLRESTKDSELLIYDTSIGSLYPLEHRLALKQLLSDICCAPNPDNKYLYLHRNALTYDLLYLLMQNYCHPQGLTADYTDEEANSRLISILEYLDAHSQEYLPLQSTAKHFGFSPAYFSRLFKQSIGMTFTAYLEMVRLDTALRLVKTTNLPILQVCEQSGFQNYPIFVKKFQQRYHDTPLHFRKNTKNG